MNELLSNHFDSKVHSKEEFSSHDNLDSGFNEGTNAYKFEFNK